MRRATRRRGVGILVRAHGAGRRRPPGRRARPPRAPRPTAGPRGARRAAPPPRRRAADGGRRSARAARAPRAAARGPRRRGRAGGRGCDAWSSKASGPSSSSSSGARRPGRASSRKPSRSPARSARSPGPAGGPGSARSTSAAMDGGDQQPRALARRLAGRRGRWPRRGWRRAGRRRRRRSPPRPARRSPSAASRAPRRRGAARPAGPCAAARWPTPARRRRPATRAPRAGRSSRCGLGAGHGVTVSTWPTSASACAPTGACRASSSATPCDGRPRAGAWPGGRATARTGRPRRCSRGRPTTVAAMVEFVRRGPGHASVDAGRGDARAGRRARRVRRPLGTNFGIEGGGIEARAGRVPGLSVSGRQTRHSAGLAADPLASLPSRSCRPSATAPSLQCRPWKPLLHPCATPASPR